MERGNKEMNEDKKLLRWKCPRCGLLGNIDDEQRLGKVSIICPEDEGGCGWHGYMGDPK